MMTSSLSLSRYVYIVTYQGVVWRIRTRFDSRRYKIFCVAVGLERGSLSLVRINEELLERKVAAPV
jgi:hypothetical protein